MRSFGKYAKNYNGVKKARKERTSTEWDVRIDTTASDADQIVENLRSTSGDIAYALVSGIEEPDVVEYGSKDNHVHICLVFHEPKHRHQALSYCRGLIKKGEEYAVPRNRKFTYAGWYMHHTKWGWKLPEEPSVRYEAGTLPKDSEDAETYAKILTMYKKFGHTDGLDKAHEDSLKEKFNIMT